MSNQLSVIVCKGPTCRISGSDALVKWCLDLEKAGLLSHSVSPCTGNCWEAPVVEWNGEYITEASPEGLTDRLIREDLKL